MRKNKYFNIFIILILLFASFYFISSVSAANFTVSGTNFNNIQTAINSAHDGDTINLGNKFYQTRGTPLEISKNNLLIKGQSSNAYATLSGDYDTSIVHFTGNNITFRFVNFANGYNSTHSGAIYSSGSLIIENCNFSDNNGNYGGHIYLSKSISSNTVLNSNFDSGSGVYGGAIYNNGKLSVSNSKFTNNQAQKGSVFYNNGSLNLNLLTFSSNKVGISFSFYIKGNIVRYDKTTFLSRATVGNNINPNSNGIYSANNNVVINGKKFSKSTIYLSNEYLIFSLGSVSKMILTNSSGYVQYIFSTSNLGYQYTNFVLSSSYAGSNLYLASQANTNISAIIQQTNVYNVDDSKSYYTNFLKKNSFIKKHLWFFTHYSTVKSFYNKYYGSNYYFSTLKQYKVTNGDINKIIQLYSSYKKAKNYKSGYYTPYREDYLAMFFNGKYYSKHISKTKTSTDIYFSYGQAVPDDLNLFLNNYPTVLNKGASYFKTKLVQIFSKKNTDYAIKGQVTPIKKIIAINKWVAVNTGYSLNKDYFAPVVYNANIKYPGQPNANCVGYSNLQVALMRTAGIPTSYIYIIMQEDSGDLCGHIFTMSYEKKGSTWIIHKIDPQMYPYDNEFGDNGFLPLNMTSYIDPNKRPKFTPFAKELQFYEYDNPGLTPTLTYRFLTKVQFKNPTYISDSYITTIN